MNSPLPLYIHIESGEYYKQVRTFGHFLVLVPLNGSAEFHVSPEFMRYYRLAVIHPEAQTELH